MNSTIPKIDIRPDHWEIVRDILHKHVPDYDVWAFGSRAKWTAKQYSDLDLAVITDKPLSLEVSANLSDDFSESDLPWKVDIVDWATTQDNFREIIKRDKVVVQKAKGWGMSADFILTTIGDQLTLQRGFDITKDKQIPGTIPVVSSGGISSFHNEAKVNGPGVVLGRKGSLGTVFYIEENFWPHDTSLWVKDFKGNNPRFIYYFFKSIAEKLKKMDVGAANPALNRNHVHPIEVFWPNRKIQDDIVEILSSLDNKIHLNTQTNQTLESIAQAIFKSWFVDFDPVKAKIAAIETGGTQEAAELAAMCVISGKDEAQLAQLKIQDSDAYQQLAQTAALFPSAMVESELGGIPEGWEVALLSSKIDVLNGFAFKSEDYVEQGTFVLRTKNFSNGIAEPLHDDVFLPSEFLVSHAKYLCEPFDYHLIMVGASVGNRGIIFPELLPALRNQNMWCFRPKNGSGISKAQSKLLLDRLISSVSGLASGSAREFFRKGDFENQKICFGSEAITESFEKLTSSLYEKQSAIFSENIRLTQLRDSLLPKLLSGEIDLSDIQSEVA